MEEAPGYTGEVLRMTAAYGADLVSHTAVSDCVEMHQNGQDENVAFFWHQICRGARLGDSESLAMARDTKKTDPKAIVSLWMPRRKSPIFKLPVLIQFQVAADMLGEDDAYMMCQCR